MGPHADKQRGRRPVIQLLATVCCLLDRQSLDAGRGCPPVVTASASPACQQGAHRSIADTSAPAASKRRKKSSSPNGTGPRLGEPHAHFVRDVELAIDSWLESAGESTAPASPNSFDDRLGRPLLSLMFADARPRCASLATRPKPPEYSHGHRPTR
jgi:hypothetical protein